MPVEVSIEALRFADGSNIPVPPDGALVVVGPNSSGKSSLLREIGALLVNPPAQNQFILNDIDLKKDGLAEDAVEWFRQNVSGETFLRNQSELGFKNSSGEVSVSGVQAQWPYSQRLAGLAQFFVAHQYAESRLQLLQESSLHDQLNDLPGDPIQFLYCYPELEEKLRGWVKEAFGLEVSLNRYGMSMGLRIGKLSRELPPPPPPREILQEYASMRSITTEGDGVRAFVGLLLHIMLTPTKITIIDEPEAFLHPPQARRLGQLLLQSAPAGSQLVIATHSRDFLQGILEAKDRPVKIVRLEKRSGAFIPSTVEPGRIQQTWADPLMRYSDLLSGLFHEGAVVCEGDADCRFYQAVMDTGIRGASGSRDLLFTHVGGKARLGKAMRQLRDFHVKSATVADFDILNDVKVLKSAVEGAGGDWTHFEADFKSISSAIDGMGMTIPTVDSIRSTISAILSGLSGKAPLPNKAAEGIRSSVGFKSPWQQIKLGGIAALPSPAAVAAKRLLTNLGDIGIFVVPVGELERWIPLEVGKQGWLVEVLEDGHYLTPPPALVDFLRRISSYFGSALPS
ncbi:AAA family ATPase [Micromonospora tulbaghiae]|uniref:ATP-dependent nuclease n=1 Tax=Micromonospora tulbaghiae TaxID=479978 RepID=UPI0033C0AF4B